jgi:hypothetical protein
MKAHVHFHNTLMAVTGCVHLQGMPECITHRVDSVHSTRHCHGACP